MGTPTGLLEQGFADALRRAAELDSQADPSPERRHICPSLTETNVELVQEALDYYRLNQSVIDTAIQAAADYVKTAEGKAHLAALQASVGAAGATSLSAQLAANIFNSNEFAPVRSLGSSSSGDNLKAFGIGVADGSAAVRGRLEGADLVFGLYSGFNAVVRKWKGRSCETGIMAFGGLEFSFWMETPLTGDIAGLLIDLYAIVLPGVIRYNSIRQRSGDGTKGTFAGVSLQLGFGEGLGLFISGAFGGYGASQTALDRAELSVLDTSTGVNSIAVAETDNTLSVTLTNTATKSTTIEEGGYLMLNLPSFFTSADLDSMNVDSSYWDYTLEDNGKMKLTATGDFTWTGNNLTFDITGVGSSETPKNASEPEIGFVTASVFTSSTDKVPMVLTTQFDLVWSNSSACLQWTAVLNSDDFTLVDGYSLYGTTPATAAPGEQIEVLTKVEYTDGTIWDLGYIYNYNTQYKATPQICAVWYKDGAQQRGNNIVESGAISASGEVTCYYAGLDTTGSYIKICAVFDPTEDCSVTSQYTCS
ncbi:MAG: hypothetical protein JST22_04520 [Bacteroidetes bacterium]|nr:hypothetical protein [Bacteroidota bacterium]